VQVLLNWSIRIYARTAQVTWNGLVEIIIDRYFKIDYFDSANSLMSYSISGFVWNLWKHETEWDPTCIGSPFHNTSYIRPGITVYAYAGLGLPRIHFIKCGFTPVGGTVSQVSPNIWWKWKWHEPVLLPLATIEQKKFYVWVYTDDEAWNAVLINEAAYSRIVRLHVETMWKITPDKTKKINKYRGNEDLLFI
jgi:hypothetical protein